MKVIIYLTKPGYDGSRKGRECQLINTTVIMHYSIEIGIVLPIHIAFLIPRNIIMFIYSTRPVHDWYYNHHFYRKSYS